MEVENNEDCTNIDKFIDSTKKWLGQHEYSFTFNSIYMLFVQCDDRVVFKEGQIMWKDEVKAARKAAGLTQAKMNQLMKVPMRTIQSWEAGDRIPPEYVQILVLEKLKQIKNNTK